MTSLRRRLLFGLAAGFAAALLSSVAIIYWAVRGAMTGEFDRLLESRAAALASVIRFDDGRIEVDLAPGSMPWFEPGPESEYFELRLASDDRAGAAVRVIATSNSLAGASLAWPAGDTRGVGDRAVIGAGLPDGRPGRVLVRVFTPAPDEVDADDTPSSVRVDPPRVELMVARSRAGLDRSLRALGGSLFLSATIAAGLAALAVRAGVSRGLRPLTTLSDGVRRMDAATLSSRLQTRELPEELRPIAERLNDLFARLEGAFERERRFSAGAAHELRTPVAELRTLLEIATSRPRTHDDDRATLRTALDVSKRLDRLVTGLLTLMRHEHGAAAAPAVTVDAAGLVRRLAERIEPAASSIGARLSVTAPSPAPARADEALLETVLDNLLENAFSHAGPSKDVAIEVRPDGDSIRIEISNQAERLAPGDEGLMFEPFWRAAEARTSGDHLGLGLTIARRLAEAMGGRLEAALDQGPLLRMLLTVPAARPGSSAGVSP